MGAIDVQVEAKREVMQEVITMSTYAYGSDPKGVGWAPFDSHIDSQGNN